VPSAPLQGNEPDEVVRTITGFVNRTIMARGHPVGPDDDLQAAGVDSMALLKILLFIETEFGFWMPDEDLVEEHLASARALASYVCRRGGPRGEASARGQKGS
jgi:acyl carrier protein